MTRHPKSFGCRRPVRSSPSCRRCQPSEHPTHRVGCASVGTHTRTRETPPRRSRPAPPPSPSAQSCLRGHPHTHRTALRANRALGSATVTHPFHRLRGQTFEVLKVRRLSGRDSLSLRDPERGTFAMPRDWTDWAPPGVSPSPGREALLIDAFGLVQLAELVACLKRGDEGVDR